ncbi:MAG: DUF5615 family PIN-like protein [Planctomycetes bacterium]|nr:DUF5615 family PIN-like protein [Planctomycetota bacterium]
MPRLLRFLAYESCDFAVARALRIAGHDVEAVAEHSANSVDRELIRRALESQRILLTEDRTSGGWCTPMVNAAQE